MSLPSVMLGLVGTIVGGLILAALLGWVRRPRLIVLVPRLFSYSQITDKGQLVEISLFNRGFKTEEAVELTLNHNLTYNLLGASDSEAKVSGSKVLVPRLGPSDEVTVLLLVEGGSFKQEDILKGTSKDSKANLVPNLEAVPPTGPQRVGILAFVVIVPSLILGMVFGLGWVFDKVASIGGASPTRASASSSPAVATAQYNVQGWRFPSFQSDSTLLGDLKANRISVNVESPTFDDDIASITVSVVNSTERLLRYTFRANSALSAKRFKIYDLVSDQAVVGPGRSERRTLKLVIPRNGDVADRTAFLTIEMQDSEEGSISLKKSQEVVRRSGKS